jgi:Putative MetA-pathway of phenol degradation
MPSPVRGNRVQSDLLFQPLLPLKLNNDWRGVFRPVLTLFDSVPSLDQTGKTQRTTGFGDTILAAALSPRTTLVGSWLLALGPTFILPTGGTELGQKKWQLGPFSAVGYRGEHFIAYVLPQQWFSIGGNGKKPTSQMSMSYSFVYFFKSGWTVGTPGDL